MVDKAIISQRTLKYIAYVSMFIDHLAVMLNKHMLISADVYSMMRVVGRLAFPLFLFFLVQGATYTKFTPRYLGRMALFAIISEVPYDIYFYNGFPTWQRQNIYFELFTCLALVVLLNRLLPCNRGGCAIQRSSAAPAYGDECADFASAYGDECTSAAQQKNGPEDVDFCPAYIVFFTAIMCIPAYFLHFSYGFKGVIATAFIYKYVQERNLFEAARRNNQSPAKHQIMGILYLCFACSALLINSSKNQLAGFLVIPLILLCSNKYTKQSKAMQVFFYLFYPVHLVILILISQML